MSKAPLADLADNVRERNTSLSNVTLAIIAGGMGTRMGRPKAWLKIGGKSILSWMLNRLHWPGPTMLVTAPSVPTPPGADQFSQHVIDPIDGVGPLRGVLTALENTATPLLVALAVDMPLMERDYLDWLCRTLIRRPDCMGAMGQISDGGESRIEPFPAAFRIEAAGHISSELNRGRRSLHKLCDDPTFAVLPASADWPAEMWTNLNDPTQLRTFQNSMVNCAQEPAV